MHRMIMKQYYKCPPEITTRLAFYVFLLRSSSSNRTFTRFIDAVCRVSCVVYLCIAVYRWPCVVYLCISVYRCVTLAFYVFQLRSSPCKPCSRGSLPLCIAGRVWCICVSLCIAVYRGVSLCIAVYRCVSLASCLRHTEVYLFRTGRREGLHTRTLPC